MLEFATERHNIMHANWCPRYVWSASSFDIVSAYNDRYKNIAKFIVTTGGDEFFQPDDAHYYFDQLEGPKYLR